MSAAPRAKMAARPLRLPGHPQPRSAPAPRPTRRRVGPARRTSRSALAFTVLTAAIAAVMILGLVALQALLAQSSFQIDALQGRVARATQANQALRSEAARLASPGRIADAARTIGMTLPSGGIQVLHVPNGPPARQRGKAVAGVRP